MFSDYAYTCDKCGRGTNTLTNNMCTWCYNKWKKEERIRRKLEKKRKFEERKNSF